MRRQLRDTGEVARQIMDGELDDQLDYIQQAVTARRHNLFRRGTRVRIIGDPKLDGQVGTVIKVNPKRIVVGLGERNEWGHHDREYSVPPSMLELVTEGDEDDE